MKSNQEKIFHEMKLCDTYNDNFYLRNTLCFGDDMRSFVLFFMFLCCGLVGCGTDQLQTPELIRTNNAFVHKSFAFEGNYEEAVERLKKQAQICFARRKVTRSADHKGVYSTRVTDYTPTVKADATQAELSVQAKMQGVGLKLWSEPEKGFYIFVVDLAKGNGKELTAHIHYAKGWAGIGGMESYAQAAEGWLRGTQMLCPQLQF